MIRRGYPEYATRRSYGYGANVLESAFCYHIRRVRLLLFHLIFRILPFLCIIPYFAARIFLVTEFFISLMYAPEGVYDIRKC